MQELEQKISSIQQKLQQLLKRYHALQKENQQQKQLIALLQEENRQHTNTIDDMQQQLLVLKASMDVLAPEDKRTIENKINQYISNIDKCIEQLSQ